MLDNLETLCDVHGSRSPGTLGDRGAVEFMVARLRKYGIESARAEAFTMPGWTPGHASLDIISPVRKSLSVIGLPHTVAGTVEATLVDLGTADIGVFDARSDEMRGAVVLTSNARTAAMKRPMHRTEKLNRSIMAGAAGFIYMNSHAGFGPVTGSVSPTIPCVGIGLEQGRYLQRALKRFGAITVRLSTQGEHQAVETFNVIADVPGRRGDVEHIVVGSHYDGHDISQGAYDPGSGVVIVMEIARMMHLLRDRLGLGVRFILFGGEETGLHGSRRYVDAHEGDVRACRFMLNLDSAGGAGRKGFILHEVPELVPLIEHFAAEMSAQLPLTQRLTTSSDHWPFFLKGVPTASGADPDVSLLTPYSHTRYDTVDKVDLEDLRRAASNYSRFIFRLANTDINVLRRRDSAQVAAAIASQGQDDALALVNRVKTVVGTWSDIRPETAAWLRDDSAW